MPKSKGKQSKAPIAPTAAVPPAAAEVKKEDKPAKPNGKKGNKKR